MKQNAEARSSLGQKTGAWLSSRSLDRHFGRGSFDWLHRLDPERQYTQFIYAREVGNLLQPHMRWLDAGSGHQILEARLDKEEHQLVGRASLAVGCDLSLAALRRHRSLTNRVCCALRQLPFPDRSFDLVTLNMVVEHLDEPKAVFAELARVVDSKGWVIVHTPNAASYVVRLMRLGRHLLPEAVVFRVIRYLEHRRPEDVFPTFYRANTRGRLSYLARVAGLAEHNVSLLTDRPLFYFAAPLSALELLLGRLFLLCGWRELVADTILGFYRRLPVPGSAQQEQGR